MSEDIHDRRPSEDIHDQRLRAAPRTQIELNTLIHAIQAVSAQAARALGASEEQRSALVNAQKENAALVESVSKLQEANEALRKELAAAREELARCEKSIKQLTKERDDAIESDTFYVPPPTVPPLSDKELTTIQMISAAKLAENKKLRDELKQCQEERDKAILAEYPNLPEPKPAPRCPKCGGFWVTVHHVHSCHGDGWFNRCDMCREDDAMVHRSLDAALDAWRGGAK